MSAEDSRLAEEARASGRQAADRAVAIDSKNSEALYIKSMLLDRHDWIGRENLLKRAVAARRLDCGCEHHQYGWMLVKCRSNCRSGRTIASGQRHARAVRLHPADAGRCACRRGEARRSEKLFRCGHRPCSEMPALRSSSRRTRQPRSATSTFCSTPKLPISADLRTALLKGYRAVASRDAGAKAQAVQALLALPEDQQNDAVARLLADLGANHEASRSRPG